MNTRLGVETINRETRDKLIEVMKNLPITRGAKPASSSWIIWTLKTPNSADEYLKQWKEEGLVTSFAYENIPISTIAPNKNL